MATEPTITNKPSFTATDMTDAASFGATFDGAPEARTDRDSGGTMQFEAGYKPPVKKPLEGTETKEVPEHKEKEAEEPKEGTEEEDGKVEDTGEDLGEWKPDDAEVAAKFEARYFKEGKLNETPLSTEFFANKAKLTPEDIKAGKVAGLNDSTYAFLEDTLGITKAFAKQVEAGLEANNALVNEAFWKQVGGEEAYNTALDWGKKNYTPAQRERFNAALKKGGEDRLDAIEALQARYTKANPQAATAGRRGPPAGQRRSAPERTAAGTAGTPQGQKDRWENHAAYAKDWSKAIAAEKAAVGRPAKEAAKAHIEDIRAAARAQFR